MLAQRRDGPDERAELWKASVERYEERRRRKHAAAWYAFHANMADCHARLSEEHRENAEALLEDRGRVIPIG